jgi:choline dehydrogenase
MIWTRGNKRDYDLWSESGNAGWSYDEVLPFFKKIEAHHAYSGAVSIEDIPYR